MPKFNKFLIAFIKSSSECPEEKAYIKNILENYNDIVFFFHVYAQSSKHALKTNGIYRNNNIEPLLYSILFFFPIENYSR